MSRFHNTRRILSLLLTFALLVSTFCATVPTGAAEGENYYAKVWFNENGMQTEGAAIDWGRYGGLENGEIVQLTDGESAGQYALEFDAGNERLMGNNPPAFSEGSYTVTATFVFGGGRFDTDVPYMQVGFGTDDVRDKKVGTIEWAVETISFGTTASEIANSSSITVMYTDSSDAARADAYLISIEIMPKDAANHTFQLNSTVDGGSAEATVSNGSHSFGTSITVTATPSEGYAFTGWQDDGGEIVSTDASYTFSLIEDTTLTPVFDRQYTFTLDYDENENVNGNKVISTVNGNKVTLTATPNTGYAFMGW